MVASLDRLAALRECCRDEAAFIRLRQILADDATSRPAPQPNLLQGIAEATSQLLTRADFTQAIDIALTTLGEATGVDRVYIFAIHNHPATGEPAASHRFEWVRDSIPAQIDNPVLQNFPYVAYGLSRWHRSLAAGLPFRTLVRSLPPAEQQDLILQDVLSLLIVPIQINGALWGFIGFDDCHHERQWSNDEEAALQTMAASIGGAIARQQSEAESRQSEARYKAMLDASPDLMFRLSREGQYLDFKGDSAAEVPREAILGRYLSDLLPPAVAALCLNAVRQTLETGNLQTCEYQLPHSLGWRDYEARIVVSGEDEVLAIVRDITEAKRDEAVRQQSEAALRLSEDKFSKAFRSSPNPMTIATLETGRLIEVNDSFLQAVGYEREAVIGRTVHELGVWVNPSDRARMTQLLRRDGTIRSLECQFRSRSGELFTTLFSAEIIHIDGELCLIDVAVDITCRLSVEQQLWAAAERDRLLGEIALRVRQSLDLEQILSTTVAEVRQFLQADRVHIGQTDSRGAGQVLAESVDPQWRSMLGLINIDEQQLQEFHAIFAEGRTHVVNDVTQMTQYPASAACFAEYQIRASLGVPLVLGSEMFGLLVVNQCSAPRQWEPFEVHLLERLATQVSIAIQQAQLYRQVQDLNAGLEQLVAERTAQLQQKMEELQELHQLKDEFLNAFSHDLRTPVMGISLVIKNLLNQGGDLIAIPRSILERMVQSSSHQLNLINSLLQAYSSETQGVILHYELVQLSLLTQIIAEDLEPLIVKNQATFENRVPPDLPLVNADPMQLRRVFENLITNALHHNPPSVHLVLTARIEEELIWFTLEDDGVGMTQEVCDRLFDRYVRGARSRHTGIGLGLYLCRQIITAHGGQIGVDSTLQVGSRFWLTLPLAIPAIAQPNLKALADA